MTPEQRKALENARARIRQQQATHVGSGSAGATDIQRYGGQQEVPAEELIAGSAPGRFVLGAGAPLYGALQLGANVGDEIAEFYGHEPVVGEWLNQNWQQLQEMKRRGMKAQGADMDVAGGAGMMGTGMAAVGRIPLAQTLRGRIGQGAALGGGMGATTPTETDDFWDEKFGLTGQTVMGTGLGAGIPAVAGTTGAALRLGRNIIDPSLPGGTRRVAERSMRQAAGEDSPEIARLLRQNRGLPGGRAGAGEVAAPAGSREFSALQRYTEARRPTVYGRMRDQDNQSRVQALRTIGRDRPSLEAAERARTQATRPLYQAVDESDALADPTRTVNLIDGIIEKQPGRTQLVNSLKSIRETLFEPYPSTQRASAAWKELDQTIPKRMSGADKDVLRQARTVMDRARKGTIEADEALEQLRGLEPESATARSSLQFVKDTMKTPDYVLRQNPRELQSASRNIGDILNQKGPTGAPINEAIARELSVIKRSIDNQIRKAVPEFGEAQSTYRAMSRPIDQMRTGQYLESKLVPAQQDFAQTGAQRSQSYAQALRDAPGTLRRSTGFKRHDELGDVLDPQQLRTTQEVGETLGRRADYERISREGLDRASKILGEQIPALPATGPLNQKYMIFKTIFNRLGGKMSDESMDVLSEIMENPQMAADILERVPVTERTAFQNALGQMERAGIINLSQQ